MSTHQGKIEKRELRYMIGFPIDSGIPPLRMFDNWDGGATKFGAYYIDPADKPTDHIYDQFCLNYGYKSFENSDLSKMSHIHIDNTYIDSSCIASLSFVYNANSGQRYYYTLFFGMPFNGVLSDAVACALTENNQSIIDHPLKRPVKQLIKRPPVRQLESFGNARDQSSWNWFFLIIIIIIIAYLIYRARR